MTKKKFRKFIAFRMGDLFILSSNFFTHFMLGAGGLLRTFQVRNSWIFLNEIRIKMKQVKILEKKSKKGFTSINHFTLQCFHSLETGIAKFTSKFYIALLFLKYLLQPKKKQIFNSFNLF